MRIEQFFEKAKADNEFAQKSRMLVIRNRIEQTELRKMFLSRPQQFGWIRLCQCVTSAGFVPPADRVFSAIRQMVRAQNEDGKIAYVTGLSALLVLWDFGERASAFEQVKTLLDDASVRVIFFVRSYPEEAQSALAHPRYAEGNSVMVVGEQLDDDNTLEVRLVSSRIANSIDGITCPSLSGFLSDFEIGGFPSQAINITVDSFSTELAGVGGSVKQVINEGDYLRAFCNYNGGMSRDAENWLYAKMVDSGKKMIAAKDFAQMLFFQGNMQSVCRDAPRMLASCTGSECEVLVWMLMHSLRSDRYLYKVLFDPKFNIHYFKSCYINEAILLLGDANERALCHERFEGISEMLREDGSALDAEIADFIEQTKDVDSYQIIPWLTNRTRFEKQECVRRLRTCDLATLPSRFYQALPMLESYLSSYALGDEVLNLYFTEYRRLKVRNEVTDWFYEKARDIQYPLMGIKTREDLLSSVTGEDVAVLVVDAMGAEYLPLIVSLAEKRGLDIAMAAVAQVKIPTSTKFNKITGNGVVLLDGIPDLDNVIHNGAHTHGVSTDEENFVAMLDVFSEIVVPAVSRALAKYKRVVLTADHGASRLAVLSSRQHLAKTLDIRGVDNSTEDWRYLSADPNVLPPLNVASNISGSYWVVKGYDRFSKSGGKLNELHGGLTYEEVLVPFVVFEKGATYTPVQPAVPKPEQLVENDDFDL